MLRRITTALCLLLFSGFVTGLLAQSEGNPDRAVIEIIEVSHRNPVGVKDQIAHALDPRGSIGVVDNKLIIASTAANFAQLRDLVAQADIPLRRLVVSVDFDHASPLNAAAQQSQQAIEGDSVRFESAAAATPATAQPQVQVYASIHNNLADVTVDVLNVEGLTGRYQLQMQLGTWYVLNPPQAQIEEFEFDPALDGARDLPEPELLPVVPENTDPLATPAAAPVMPTVAAAIAVRVDVLP